MIEDYRKSIPTVVVKDFHDNTILKIYRKRILVSTLIYNYNKEGYAVMFPVNWRKEITIYVRKEV